MIYLQKKSNIMIGIKTTASSKPLFVKLIFVSILLFCSTMLFAQVSINTSGNDPDNSAMLDVSSSSKGLLLPRMTTFERDQITQPAEGLIIYNTTDNALNFYSGQVWFTLGSLNLCSPSINTNPSNSEGCIGDNISFVTVASGDGLTYLWQENQGSGFANVVNGGIYSGANTENLQLTGIQQSIDNYQYRCIVTGSCPPNDTTETATLSVFQPAQIATSPMNALGCEFDNVQFYITANGDNLSYQWQEDSGSGFVNIFYQGYNSDMLNVDVFQGMDGYDYRCVVTDNCTNSVISGSGELTVLETAYFTSVPPDQSISAGGNASFPVTTIGTVQNYMWEENQGSGFTPLSDGGVYSGTGSSTLSITGATTSMNGYLYHCIIFSDCGYEISGPATLTVN
jgi:hypothetical protein